MSSYDDWKLDNPEPKGIALDWLGYEVYEGEYCFDIEGELVLEDDIMEFINHVYGEARPIHKEDLR